MVVVATVGCFIKIMIPPSLLSPLLQCIIVNPVDVCVVVVVVVFVIVVKITTPLSLLVVVKH